MNYSDSPVRDAERHHDDLEAAEVQRDAARPHAVAFITGGDAELTGETFAEFAASHLSDETPLPLLTKPAGWVQGPVSNARLLCLLLTNVSDAMTATAIRELRARYVADPYTQTVVDGQIDKLVGSL
jgi:hypothetical protein